MEEARTDAKKYGAERRDQIQRYLRALEVEQEYDRLVAQGHERSSQAQREEMNEGTGHLGASSGIVAINPDPTFHEPLLKDSAEVFDDLSDAESLPTLPSTATNPKEMALIPTDPDLQELVRQAQEALAL